MKVVKFDGVDSIHKGRGKAPAPLVAQRVVEHPSYPAYFTAH